MTGERRPMTRIYEPPTEAELVAEFLARPLGPHSPELQRFVAGLLADPGARDVVVLTLVPFRRWALGRLPADRSARVVIERERVFDDEEEALRALFLRRLASRSRPAAVPRA